MLRWIFALLVFIHGFIHLMGFAKAFKLAPVNQLTSNISATAGVLWLLACLLFIATAILFLVNKSEWWIIAVLALIVSQALIIQYWHDAKAGTIANVIVLFAAIVAFSNWNFNKNVRAEVKQMLQDNGTGSKEIVTEDMLQKLPEPVKNWIRNSGIIGKEKLHTVHIKQRGWMRTKPGKDKWRPTMAEQYFTIDKPGFIWRVQMEMMPLVAVSGKDKFVDGKGQMLIKAFSLINIVNDTGEKIDQGTLQRYLAEICWFPSAALSPYIKWEAIDTTTAKATMNYNGVSGSVTFYFSKEGQILGCSADRYKGGGKDATLEKWVVTTKGYSVMNGIKMPVKSEATWKLKTGDFTWYKLEITEVEYNQPELNK